jgi:hypothetical protein
MSRQGFAMQFAYQSVKILLAEDGIITDRHVLNCQQ